MKKYNVLMLENDIDDRYITDKYFLDNGYNISVEYADKNILGYLSALDPRRMPHLILMSGKYGLDLLSKLKSHSVFCQIPVVILTELSQPFNINEAYRIGASSVIIKPSTHQLTEEKIRDFSKYWFSTVELPVPALTETPHIQ